jgi:hypothetical protein
MDLDGEAKIVKPSDEASSELGLVAAIEVVGAEVVVVDPVLEHVVARREHRRRDGEDRLLGPAAALEAEKLRAQVGLLGAHGGPTRLGRAWS